MLGETADYIAAVPEIFNYWVQPGRIDVGFLGAAQIDRYANINTTVVGDYDHPKVRLPGAGGAPEIAASCGEVIVIVRQSKRAFVEKVDFITSVGHGDGRRSAREARPEREGSDQGDHRPRHPRARPGDQGARPHPRARGRDRRAGAGGDRLGPQDRRPTSRPPSRRPTKNSKPSESWWPHERAYIYDAVRTPFGRYGGALAKVRPDDLGAHVVKQIVERNDLDPTRRRRHVRQRQRRRRGQPQRRAHGRAARRPAHLRPRHHDQPPVRLEPRRRDAGVTARSRPATPT